jgi:hypothetical protein
MTTEAAYLDVLKAIQKSIEANMAIMAALNQMVSDMDTTPSTGWRFDVERDQSGTINKITAKPD